MQSAGEIAAKMGAGEFATPLALACAEFTIDTDLKLAHFLAQLYVESAGFKHIVESLNYSVAALLTTFSRQRISAADCARYGRVRGRRANQVMIANLVYGGAFGRDNLGNLFVGDGWKYRGHGMAQLTGRANYATCSRELFLDRRLEDDPDMILLDPMLNARVAGWFWRHRKCDRAGDDVVAVTKLWNGGRNGLTERAEALARAKKLLGLPT